MARSLSVDTPSEPLPTDIPALQAEVEHLRRALREVLQEKDRVLRLLRRMNTDLYGQVQGQTRQLSSLHHLINTINASLDLNEVAATALKGLQSLLGVEVTSLALLDSTEEVRYVMSQPPEMMLTLTAIRLKKGESVIGKVVEGGQAYLANDIPSASAQSRDLERTIGTTTHSLLCQPLAVHDRIIGSVQLINKRSGPFSDPDRAFVETVAGSIAIAIENARMYQEVQTRLRELERANRELVTAQAQLVRSAKLASVGQLAAGLAHEINNPLGMILGFAQVIGQRIGDEKLKSYAGLIEREALRVKRIVADLLGAARQSTAEVTRNDLREILDKALGLVEYQLTNENIRITRAHAGEPGWVMVDRDQILQVVINLIQNARQAMPEGGGLIVRTWSQKQDSLFSITDTGLGIPEADLDRIFDPFFTTKPVGQGTGLGLSVSYRIIRRHGGDIRVASQPGAGTTFIVRLPGAVKLVQEPDAK